MTLMREEMIQMREEMTQMREEMTQMREVSSSENQQGVKSRLIKKASLEILTKRKRFQIRVPIQTQMKNVTIVSR